MAELKEPLAIWPDETRYCPTRGLPPYRFVPGLTAHPNINPAGHSYGEEEEVAEYRAPQQWRENELYLFGIDLYHQSYFWEAHEAWETLWHLTAKTDPEGQFYQGLIQNSAAQLKRHIKKWDGMAHLGKEAYRRLETVYTSGVCENDIFMGLNLSELLVEMKAHYASVWNKKEAEHPVMDAPPPRLRLIAF